MSTELRAIRKKRTSSDTTSSNRAPEGDHRKRRRNRTTQSCLNCHTSKRMCDRKRPCGRCTQLGLTGLCVYEVDDPSQRSDAQDESSRLRKRVAELEGVIRELKNKPHPRWVRSGSSPDEEFDKCHTDARSRSVSQDPVGEPQHLPDSSQSLQNSNADSNDNSLKKQAPARQALSLLDGTTSSDYFSLPSSFSSPPTGGSAPPSTLSGSPYFDLQSPPSAPSTGIMTPTDEHSQIQVAVAGDQSLSDEIDLASLFSMPYPAILPCDERAGQAGQVLRGDTHSQLVDPHSIKYDHGQFLDGHCGCLNEVANYNVVLELSLRLRKAADVLSHSAGHWLSNGCPLNQRVVNLDAFATAALGSMTVSPNDFGSMPWRSRANAAPGGPVAPAFTPSSCIPPLCDPAISPHPFRGVPSWNAIPCASGPASASCEESFMTWEPSRRRS